MHFVVSGVVDFNRQESPRADVQGQRLVANPGLSQRAQQFGGEVQSGGRRGHCAVFGGEHRLIVALVLRISRALARDVRRERHLPGAFEQQFDWLFAQKRERPAAIIGPHLGLGLHPGGEFDCVTLMQPLGIADEGVPAAQIDPFVQRRPDLCGTAPSLKLRRDHPRVVEHQHIARAQQAGQIAHRQIGQRPLARHQQQPRRIARARRAQRDPLGR